MESQQSQKQTLESPLSKQDWLSLSLIKGVGPARLNRLFEYLSELVCLSESDKHHLTDLRETINRSLLMQLKWPEDTAIAAVAYLSQGVLSNEAYQQILMTHAWLEESPYHHLIMRSDSAYPVELKQISVAPLFIYVKGELSGLYEQPKLALVGARKASQYGKQTAYQFAQQLSEQGFSIVSGGAIGIDTAAHKGTLSVQGKTIAVMGAGLFNLYPKSNLSLYDEILSLGGCLISESPLSTKVQARLFPARNRIVSGLSLGVIVVEAGFKSGSLISANYAIQQNREVFAVPARITDLASAACLDLIKQGAKLITHLDDVLEEFEQLDLPYSSQNMDSDLKTSKLDSLYPSLNIQNTLAVSRETQDKNTLIPSPYVKENLTQHELKVLNYMDDRLTDSSQKNEFELDQLVSELDLRIDEVMQTCLQLELSELVEPLMTGYARRFVRS